MQVLAFWSLLSVTLFLKYAKTIADRVRDSEEYEDDNYYIFINSIGTPISASSWNDTLRGIFAEVGIPVDRDCRKSNLNHRFRHGFAMYNVMYLNVKEVMTFLASRGMYILDILVDEVKQILRDNNILISTV